MNEKYIKKLAWVSLLNRKWVLQRQFGNQLITGNLYPFGKYFY
jgi:hypothetical protein